MSYEEEDTERERARARARERESKRERKREREKESEREQERERARARKRCHVAYINASRRVLLSGGSDVRGSFCHPHVLARALGHCV